MKFPAIFSAFDADGNDITQHVRDCAEAAKDLCDLIVSSDSSTTIKGRIQSLAFELGHQELILNIK